MNTHDGKKAHRLGGGACTVEPGCIHWGRNTYKEGGVLVEPKEIQHVV
jgi:hypothetical protein